MESFFHKQKPLSSSESLSPSPQHKAAGCVFHNDKFILAGYQKTKLSPTITGIGGKREGQETPIQTALREMIEELFELKKVPRYLIEILESTIPPRRSLQNKGYFLFCYTFDDLQSMLKIISEKNIQSPCFEQLPLSLNDLLFERSPESHAEISHLALLPLVIHKPKYPFVCPTFLKDIELILNEENSEDSLTEDRQNEDSLEPADL